MNSTWLRRKIKSYAERLIADHDEFMAAVDARTDREIVRKESWVAERDAREKINHTQASYLLRIIEAPHDDTQLTQALAEYLSGLANSMTWHMFNDNQDTGEIEKMIFDRVFGYVRDASYEEGK